MYFWKVTGSGIDMMNSGNDKKSRRVDSLTKWMSNLQLMEIGLSASYLSSFNFMVHFVVHGQSREQEMTPGQHVGFHADLGSNIRVLTNYTKTEQPVAAGGSGGGESNAYVYTGVHLHEYPVEHHTVLFTGYVVKEEASGDTVKKATLRSRLSSNANRDLYEDDDLELARAQLTEEDRVKMREEFVDASMTNLRRVRRTFSKMGFGLGRLPNDLWASMKAYYHNNRDNTVMEFWTPQSVITNSYDSPTHMAHVPFGLRAYWQERIQGIVGQWVNGNINVENAVRTQQDRPGVTFSEHLHEIGGRALFDYGASPLQRSSELAGDSFSQVQQCRLLSHDGTAAHDAAADGDGVHIVWHDKEMQCLNRLLEETSTVELEQTSLYGFRMYESGARLLHHTDILSTHAASIIINVAQYGVSQPWPLEILDHGNEMHQVTMAEGDILFYESARLLHGRVSPLKGGRFVNVFAHYRPVVPADTPSIQNLATATEVLLPPGMSGDPLWYSRENPLGTVQPVRSGARRGVDSSSSAAVNMCVEGAEGGWKKPVEGQRGGGGRGFEKHVDEWRHPACDTYDGREGFMKLWYSHR
jgi:hypothetical protein